MSTPSKRRRTSFTTYINVNDQENIDQVQGEPTTPKRASYQSPTKASMARSNPIVLHHVEQAKERRESETNRRQSLRDAVLGSKPIESGGQQEQEQGLPSSSTGEALQEDLPRGTRGSLATDISDAFKDPPSTRPAQAEAWVLSTPQQEENYTPRRSATILPSFTSPSIVPRLVQSTSNSQQHRRSTSAELPPTPVQLGSGTRADRPRGLASSSPGGSGRRGLRGGGGHVTSSPLKPKQRASVLIEQDEALDDAEVASGIGDDVEQTAEEPTPEADIQADETLEGPSYIHEEVGEPAIEANMELDSSTTDPTIRDKQTQLTLLTEELEAIQETYNKLRRLSTTIGQNNLKALSQDRLDEHLDFVLHCLPEPKKSWPPALDDHPLFKKNTASYLTLFTPGNLRMSYECWQETTKSRNKFVYQTTFAAPEPWPVNTLNMTFDIITDQATGQIEKIVFAKNRQHPAALQKWIEARLCQPMFKTDLATIVTGIGRYFEADVQRAITIKNIGDRVTSPAGEQHNPRTGFPVQSREDAISLLPFLNTSRHAFTATPTQAQRTTRHSCGSSKCIMLLYDISHNWIGQTDTKIDICTSGFNDSAVQAARKLFRAVEAVDGVENAFEGVWGVLGIKGTEQGPGVDLAGHVVNAAATTANGLTKGKRKARRMTEFKSPVKQ